MRQHRIIPALRLKHRSGGSPRQEPPQTAVALRSASLRLGVRHGICVAKMLDNTQSIICAFGLAAAAPRSPYRYLELCGIALNLKSARLCHAHERALFLRQCCRGRACPARGHPIRGPLWQGCGPHMCGPYSSTAKIRRRLVQSAAEYAIIHLYILE